ncbi:MAG: Gfo/Idh/MocA family oxidoreductase [Deltaproteobacteria bacterium]|nr:Gfo/Idh/MocA family oxidoreductase [Deltaproteobacteria bacterium]
MIQVGVIGYGYWGPNLVRNFLEVPGCRVVMVSDLRPERLALVQQRYPGIRITVDYHDLISDPAIDAIAIATPVHTHFSLALEALRLGKHVLVEKPLADTSDHCLQLIEEAAGRNKVLMVDHTFVYTGAVRKIRELVEGDSLGDLYYYDSVRINLGLFHNDVNVIWDLAVHDLSIMDFVMSSRPIAVSATGIRHIQEQPENIAYLTLFFNNFLIAHLHVNWLAPVKIRRTLLGGSQRMVVYDDLEFSEKVKVYDKGVTVNSTVDSLYQVLVGYRTGDMWAPQLSTTEALLMESQHFISCIEKGEHPVTDGQAGLRVVRIIEAATQSMAQRGRPMDLSKD